MISPGDIISYYEMCMEEWYSLQRGMNFQINNGSSVILMSLRKNAPYTDSIKDEWRILIYEGHDVPKNLAKNPKEVNQPRNTPSGILTQNGKFESAAIKFKTGIKNAELIKVYEKIKDGIWCYNGIFELYNSWEEESNDRTVFKFELHITSFSDKKENNNDLTHLEHNRIIPTSVKLEVWQRDKGKCITCWSHDNLHFDHILPFSKGWTSLKAENIQLLCARHNLQKSDRII